MYGRKIVDYVEEMDCNGRNIIESIMKTKVILLRHLSLNGFTIIGRKFMKRRLRGRSRKLPTSMTSNT